MAACRYVEIRKISDNCGMNNRSEARIVQQHRTGTRNTDSETSRKKKLTRDILLLMQLGTSERLGSSLRREHNLYSSDGTMAVAR